MVSPRNHQIVCPAVAIILILGFCTGAWAVEFAGGKGTADDPYQVATAAQLLDIGSDAKPLAKCYVLVADIDLDPNLPGGVPFSAPPIAAPTYNISQEGKTRYVTIVSHPFTGTFDGGGHVIRNLVIKASEDHQIGLFGSVGSKGVVTNLGIEDAQVYGDSLVGILAGENSGTVSRCSVSGLVSASGIAGGLAGDNHGSVVSCKSTASVAAGSVFGGLVGWNSDTVSSSYAMSRLIPTPGCDSTGVRVSGGLVGRNNGTIEMSFAVSTTAEGGDQAGGLAGESLGSVYLSYWDRQASGIASSHGGRAKTTEQMMNAQTFRGWGQAGCWVIDDGRDYPRLQWEGTPASPITDKLNSYAGGTGEPNDPYRISTAEQFVSIAYSRSDYGKCFVLDADIDLNDVDPNLVYPIGMRDVPFQGVFDGNHHTIANFILPPEDGSNIGVFGYVDIDIIGLLTTQPIIRLPLPHPEIRALHVTGLSVQGEYDVGGLVGTLGAGLVQECSVHGNVRGRGRVGGLVGMGQGQITASFTDGSVTGEVSIGGLVGQQGSGNLIGSCYSSADVSGDSEVGGLVGDGDGVRYCYATGRVTKTPDTGRTRTTDIGGLVGTSDGALAYLCYWNAEVNPDVPDRAGQGRTTLELMQAETFRGWDVPGQWTLNEGLDYPRLAWENLPGDPLVAPARRYGGGTGEPDDPYQIWTAEQFRDIAYYPPDWTSDFALMADIDLGGIEEAELLPIGSPFAPFQGVFDGNHHAITNFRCIRPDTDYVGLFGVVRYLPMGHGAVTPHRTDRVTGVITRLHVQSARIEGRDCTGSLAGFSGGTITACSVTGAVDGRDGVGGLTGSNDSQISQSYAIADVNAVSQAGVLTGGNQGTVESCYGQGSVAALYSVGGLVGINNNRANLAASYAVVRAAVKAPVSDSEPNGTTAREATPGTVAPVPQVGALIGTNYGTTVFCLWDAEVSGLTQAIGSKPDDPANAGGLPRALMQTASTFLAENWKIGTVWTICEGKDYPRLRWEAVACGE